MAALGCTAVLPSCALPPAQVARVPYYVASVDTSAKTEAAIEQGLQVLDPRASEVLRPGITVAFFPPDRCRNISASTTTATPEMVEMQNDCGVLVSALETAVADRYSVVSWQTIKGNDPFARAAERKVDVIFEVDSLGPSPMGRDESFAGTISFYEQHEENDRVPLVLGAEERVMVGERCRAWVEEGSDHSSSWEDSFTGAIKAVEVSSGQALLYYKRTLTDEPGEESREGYDLYFRHEEPRKPAPARYNVLQKGGVAMIIVGTAALLLGASLRATRFRGTDEDGDGVKEFDQPGTAAMAGAAVGGGILVAGGIPLLVLGNNKAKRTVLPTPPLLPAELPREVLCRESATPPWLAAPTPDPSAQAGSSYSFSATQAAGRDQVRERENRLRRIVIEDFDQALGQLGGG